MWLFNSHCGNRVRQKFPFFVEITIMTRPPICTTQAVPVYFAELDQEPETEYRYQETLVDNVVVPFH